MPRLTRMKRGRSFGLLAALLAGAIAAPASAAMPPVPAIADPASPEHHPGKVVFAELVTPDIATAKHFYAELFGWTYNDIRVGKTQYTEALAGGEPVAGIIEKPIPAGEHRQPAWLSFIAVTDVDAAKTAAVAHGAKVLAEPRDVPDRGREAVFADPQGAVFAVVASSSGDPDDTLAEPGEWIWSSLITSDPDDDAGFYQSLFNYEVFELPNEGSAEHLLLATDNFARASINSIPEAKPHMHPHWLNYVRVDDADRAVAKAVSLGGRVLVEPHPDRHGGKIALVADPTGAPIGLFEWSQADSKEVIK